MLNKSNKQNNISNIILKVNLDIFRKKAKSIWFLLWRKDAFIFLLFVGLTSIFWWGHVMSSSRDMNVKVVLSYTGIPEETIINEELPTTLRIILRDEGKQLRQLSHNDLQLKINLTDFLLQEKGEVKLTTDILRHRLQDLLPGSTHIQQIAPEEISFSYHNQYSKRVPVRIQSHISTAPQYQLIDSTRITPDSVELFGNTEIIDSIHYVLTEPVIINELYDSIRVTTNLIIPQNTRIHPQEVTIGYYAEQFTEKSFSLPIKVIGKPTGEKIRLFPQRAEVTVRVCISNFSNIQASDLQLICQYPKKDCKSLPLEVKTSNPHINHIRISPSSVEYIIER